MNTEARFRVPNLAEFQKHISALNAEQLRTHEFKDHILEPSSRHFNLNRETMKVRVWKTPKKGTEVKYHAVVWEKGVKSDSFNLCFKASSGKQALSLMRSWGFKELFSFSRRGAIYKIPEGEFVLDLLDRIGPYVEIEGSAEYIERVRKELGLGKPVKKSVPGMYSESL